MVFDTSGTFEGKKKLPREKAVGKLIGIRGDFSKMKVADPEKGVFDWLELSIVTGKDTQGSDTYKNITCYKVNLEKMPELKKADDLLKAKKKPKVEVECYKTETVAMDKTTKKPIVENGEVKMWVNYRSSREDVINTFKILAEDISNEPELHPINKEEVIVG